MTSEMLDKTGETPETVPTPVTPPAPSVNEAVPPVNEADETAVEAEPGPSDDFASMLDDADSRGKMVKQGSRVVATIESIDHEQAFVSIGSKMDGYVDLAELQDAEGKLLYKPGDSVELYVTSVTETEVKLSRALSGKAGQWALRDAFQSGVPVQGKVKEVVKGGYSVLVLGQRAFCPMSQMDIRFVEKPEVMVNHVFTFKITKYEGAGRRVNVVVSRLPILRELERENFGKFEELAKTQPVMKGKVTRLESYGMFVELLPGIEGMCHVSEIAWTRLDHPSQRFKVGDEVEVKILGVEKKEKGGPKISLSVKQLLAEPWTGIADKVKAGTVVTGRVTKLMAFGAFVEIADGIEGLVHLSELTYESRNAKPEQFVKPGDKVEVKVLDINMETRKISLSLRQSGVDPWAEARKRYPIGGKVSGTIEKKEKFGWFVRLASGVTGLMPQSKLSEAPNLKELEKLNPGDPIELTVIDLSERDRKITLAPMLNPEDDWKSFTPKKEAPAQAEELGALGAALMKQMKEKGLKK